MASRPSKQPKRVDPQRVDFAGSPVTFNHVQCRKSTDSAAIYFDSIPCFSGKQRIPSSLFNIVCTFQNCTLEESNLENPSVGLFEKLQLLDENSTLIDSELTAVSSANNTSSPQRFRLSLIGTQVGGREMCKAVITGELTVIHLTRKHFAAECLKHTRGRGLSKGEAFWTNLVNTIIEKNFPNTMRILLGES